MLIIWRKKSCLNKRAFIVSVFFHNSFNVFYFNTYLCYQNPSNKNKYNVGLRFYSVVICLSQFYIMYFNQMHALTIRYRNDLNLGVLFHYCANFTFLCVVNNEQEHTA